MKGNKRIHCFFILILFVIAVWGINCQTIFAASISVNPKTTNGWSSQDQQVFVSYEGDPEQLIGATKKYELTTNTTMPSSFTNTISSDNKIIISADGEHYLHVLYQLQNGTKLYSLSGPYSIQKTALKDFTLKITNSDGNAVTGWVNEDVILEMVYAGDVYTEGVKLQYQFKEGQSDWKTTTNAPIIEFEGDHTLYARLVNKTGEISNSKTITAKVDKTPPVLQQINLKETENHTYDVSVLATDRLSGIDRVEVMVEGQTKALKKSSTGSLYSLQGLTNVPLQVKAYDLAGNVSTSNFAIIPSITFTPPYSLDKEYYKGEVSANISNGVELLYQMGSELVSCQQNPCSLTIKKNGLLTIMNEDGMKKSSRLIRIDNLNDSTPKLILNGERDISNASTIRFTWNYVLSGGNLNCFEGSIHRTIPVTGKDHPLSGQNVTYKCHLTGMYEGEMLTSNQVVVYVDQTKAEADDPMITKVQWKDVYMEESKVGNSYFINTKRNKKTSQTVPVPFEPFM